MLIVIVMLAVVLTRVMTIFVQQQRFYSDISAIIQTRSSTRDAAYVLQSDFARSLRRAATSTRWARASWSFARSSDPRSCAPSTRLERSHRAAAQCGDGAALTSWLTPPANGDTVLIFAPGSTAAAVTTRSGLRSHRPAHSECELSQHNRSDHDGGRSDTGYTFNVKPALSARRPSARRFASYDALATSCIRQHRATGISDTSIACLARAGLQCAGTDCRTVRPTQPRGNRRDRVQLPRFPRRGHGEPALVRRVDLVARAQTRLRSHRRLQERTDDGFDVRQHRSA